MEIHLVSGMGSGPTTLAAFDSALVDAGIANYNLIKLSSVIPPNSTIVRHAGPLPFRPGEWGDRLYIVMAESRVVSPNEEAWAGVGWVMDTTTKKGLLVEHHGSSRHTVEEDISDSLHALMASRNVDFGPVHMKVIGRPCHRDPVCVLVAVVFKAEAW